MEVKGKPGIVPLLRRVVEQVSFELNRLAVLSFDPAVIRKAKEILPEARALLLIDFENGPDKRPWRPTAASILREQKKAKADGVDVSAVEAVNDRFVGQMHDAGSEVHVWTVNDISQAARLWRLGVDSITTDRPKMIKALVHRLEERKHGKAPRP